MTYDPTSMTQGRIEVRSMPRGLRIYTAIVFGVCGAFFATLAWRQPARGHEVGYVVGCVMLWMALWVSRRPENVVVADESGFEYCDERLGLLLQFPIRRAAWSEVSRVDTRVVHGRYGHWLQTRVWVRDAESGSGTSRFSLRSRSPGYHAFMTLLSARIAGLPVEMTGYGVDTQRALADDRGGRGRRVAVAVLMVLLAIGLGLIAQILKHH